jgi:alkylation response protein AidB-like acyl-CoA dehydrogenase
VDLELSPDQEELRHAVRAVIEREAPVSLARAVVEDNKEAEELWAHMVELDWPSLAIPESAGGLGLGVVELAVVAEELGRVVAPGPFLATAAQYVPAVRIAGDAERCERFLGPVAQRGMCGALAVAEESGVWSAAAVQTVAQRAGDGWRLEGAKHYVVEPARAEEIVVAARLPGTEGEDGIVLAVVPTDAAEVEVMRSLDATRQYGTVRLSGVEVGPERLLSGPGDGTEALRRILQVATTVLAAETVGTCQGIFDVVLAYTHEREQFGVRIGSFQSMKHKLANMFVALESARVTATFAAAAIDEDDERTDMAVSMAKASVGDAQKLITQEGIQCLGGIGYTWEHDMQLYVKRAKVGGAFFGTGAEHREHVARLLGLRGESHADASLRDIVVTEPEFGL